MTFWQWFAGDGWLVFVVFIGVFRAALEWVEG